MVISIFIHNPQSNTVFMMKVWFREPMIVGKSGTIFWEIGEGNLILIRFSRQSRQWWQRALQFWHRNHWHHRPDWLALTIISTRHYIPERSQPNWPDTTVSTDGNLGTKKMGLVGEFKFFSKFSWGETGATDWKQTKAGNQIHQPNLFQTDSSRFSCHFKKLKKTTRVPKNPNRLYSLFLNFQLNKLSWIS